MFYSSSEKETEEFGKSFSENLESGSIIGLKGELGAGKTCFVRGLCRGLKTKETVNSPTFPLLNIYTSPAFTVYHFDLYRINDYSELEEIGFEEYLNSDGICIIEWAEKISGFLPSQTVWLELKHSEINKREIEIL